MRAWKDRPLLLRGRLHGRSLKILGAIAAVAVIIAAWQFAVALLGGGERDYSEWTGMDPLTDGVRLAPDDETAAETSASEEASPSEEEPTTSEAPPEHSEPAPESTEAASEEPWSEPEPEASQCTATLTVEDRWSGTVAVSVDVVNTSGEEIDGWTIVLDLDGAEVTSAWGMRHQDGDRWRNAFFNGELDSGQTAEPSFHASTDGEVDLPDSVPCSPA